MFAFKHLYSLVLYMTDMHFIPLFSCLFDHDPAAIMTVFLARDMEVL
ncbi:hypothetical protein CGLO_17806 [Colletotrichum gloeosporioides Cg-14]|uniref:Uncharacterized protein n=1 Tax=Colletotrichum gloeosporioides (strain Cg-14) TaxID=1237896 RepID=T0JK29_COLGC|nr:hypothetical protein CGLO_17806 [Colletotrichum gloeosporioides Cg-14]